MRPIFQAELVNGVFGDPSIYVDLKFESRALLFDIGDVSGLPTRKLLRISDVFVSHTHMDHFSGSFACARSRSITMDCPRTRSHSRSTRT